MPEPQQELENYELIIPYSGDKVGMIEFAGEIATEFGCTVVVNQVDEHGDVLHGHVDWETVGVPHD